MADTLQSFPDKTVLTFGEAITAIAAGDYVHTHNLRDITEELCAAYDRQFRETEGEA